MLARALEFAKEYQSGTDKASSLAPGGVLHPSLFVFLGADGGDAFAKIEAAASRLRSAFFLRMNESSAENEIRAVKAKIQQNEAGLNLKRVNISVTVPAYAQSFAQTGKDIRAIFEEDIAVVHMTLFLLLSESNAEADYKRRAANCYAALKQAEEFQRETSGRVFDRVFVFSDRNESDAVSGANADNNAVLIAHLPRLLNTGSHFDENLMKKSLEENRICFSTAGMARLEKPAFDIAFAAFKSAAENALKMYRRVAEGRSSGESFNSLILLQNISVEEKIKTQMQSVAAKNASAFSLRGKTLREAEDLIYGGAAERFYTANYEKDTDETAVPGNLPPGEYENALLEINARADGLAAELDAAYRRVCKPGLFGGADEVKRMIAEAYVIKYRLWEFRKLKSELERLKDAAVKRDKQLKFFINGLSAAVKELGSRPDPGGHINTFYGKVVSEIFAERENDFNGGAILTDMNEFSDAVLLFIKKYVLNDEKFNLSFDEDLRMRSSMAAEDRDGEFLNTEQFYRRTLETLDGQSALAVSLIRYDDLYREKFYLGGADTPLMAYAKQSREAVYSIEEPNGFTVIRLAGGFTPEDLTRHRIMKDCFAELR